MTRPNGWISFFPKRRAEGEWAPLHAYGESVGTSREDEDAFDETELVEDFGISPDVLSDAGHDDAR